MAARTNRPRPGPSREDPAAAQEETSMWNQILADLRICKGLNDRATALSKEVVEDEASMGKSKFFSTGLFEIWLLWRLPVNQSQMFNMMPIHLHSIEKPKTTTFHPYTIRFLLLFLNFTLVPEYYDSYEAESFLS